MSAADAMPRDVHSAPPPAGAPVRNDARIDVRIDADELLEINRLRIVARVVSNAGHDINNALQVIGGSAELLGMRSQLGPAEQRRVQAIAVQAGRISTTLDRLASFTRSGANGHQAVDLARLAADAVALRAFTLGCARIAVTVDRGPAGPCVVSADRRRILQVFLNLLLNAEAVLANRPEAAVRIRIERSGQDWSVSFTDNGPGLNAEGCAQLADMAPIPEPGPDLSGIGLWVSARIAQQHGGRLEVGDAPAMGASLRLRLPAVA